MLSMMVYCLACCLGHTNFLVLRTSPQLAVAAFDVPGPERIIYSRKAFNDTGLLHLHGVHASQP
jgi:hypothetical protein